MAARRIVRWIGWAVLGLAVAVALAIALGLVLESRRKARVFEVRVPAVAERTDAAALERGRYLYASRGCADCHGHDGAGRFFVGADGGSPRLAGPSIAPGAGSVVERYRMEDFDRAIRHGVAPGGRPLLVMPSEEYNRLTDADLAAIVAHVRALAPRPAKAAVIELPLPARVAYGFGAIPEAATKIDHALPSAEPVAEAVTREHGAYVAQSCKGCHGPDLAGGRIPGGPPHWPAAADLRPGPAMARYPDAAALQAMFRSGKRPDGGAIAVMPFEALGAMNETDVRALHLHLASLPASRGR